MDATLTTAIADVPAGAWAVGVSGGADSVALLSLLGNRADVSPVVVHLDHQLRGEESTGDAAFVRKLAERLGVSAVIAKREALEAMHDWPANPSERYRQMRLELFEQVVRERKLAGVLLAHHADDQAETVLQRLLRGSGYTGLTGMRKQAVLGKLTVFRPLLGVRRETLRSYLNEIGQPWREDASNASLAYQRNRVRAALAGDEPLVDGLLQLANACGSLRSWSEAASPVLGPAFAVGELADLPAVLAGVGAPRWLVERGVPASEIEPAVVARLIEMSQDAAVPGRQQFPGNVTIVRRKGVITDIGDFTSRQAAAPPPERGG